MAFSRTRRRRVRDADAPPPETSPRVAALRLLGRRDYTTAELRDRLTGRGYAEDDIQAAIDQLTQQRLLDDRRVAAAHVRAASRIKRRGRARIERELLARGLDRAVAHEAIAALSKDDDAAVIREIVARKQFPAKPDPRARQRMFQHLLRRGFSADLIARVLGRGRETEDADS